MKRLYRMIVNGNSNSGPVLVGIAMMFGASYAYTLYAGNAWGGYLPVYLFVMGCIAAYIMWVAAGAYSMRRAEEWEGLARNAIETCRQSNDQVTRLLDVVRSLNGDLTRMAKSNERARSNANRLLDCIERLHMMSDLNDGAREIVNKTLGEYHGWHSGLRH